VDVPRLLLILLGVSSVTTQLVTLRELLSQFHGNEITVSLAVFSWLILTGLGAFFGKPIGRVSGGVLAVFILLSSLMPLAQVAAIRLLRDLFFIHGSSQGFYSIMLFTAAVTAPYCLVSGFLLPLAQAFSRSTERYLESGALYVYDSIGDIAGGILFSFALVYLLTPFQALLVTSIPLAALCLSVLWLERRYVLFVPAAVMCSVLFLLFLHPSFERWTLKVQYGDILEYEESPYGRIVVTAEGGQKSLWESGAPLYSSGDTINAEEKIHYALAQIQRPGEVLLVSGGLGETLDEVRKHKPIMVDYVELDPFLTASGIRHGLIREGDGVRIINTDGRAYLREAGRKYDAVIFDLPEPDSFQVNRFYTDECFALVKGLLKEGGVFSISMDYSSNYLSKIERKKLSILYRTLRERFSRILIIPGEKLFFLCRDGELSEDIPGRLAEKAVRSPYVAGFFYGNVTRERMDRIKELIDPKAPLNRDFRPRLMNAAFQDWFARYGGAPTVFFLILAAASVVYLFLIRREEYVLYTTGFALMGTEMAVVFSFQSVFGFLYLQIGAIVSAFLFGLFPGALAASLPRVKQHASAALFFSEYVIIALLLLLLAWMSLSGKLNSPWAFLLYCAVFSGVCGFQFPLAAHLIGEERSPVAGCLASDLWGAACGTIASGVLMIPLLGMELSVIALIVVKISSIIVRVPGRRRKGLCQGI
jgi:spermidine synthase